MIDVETAVSPVNSAAKSSDCCCGTTVLPNQIRANRHRFSFLVDGAMAERNLDFGPKVVGVPFFFASRTRQRGPDGRSNEVQLVMLSL